MLATRVIRNAHLERLLAQLAHRGELLGPRPKADPDRKPRRESIKMAPPTGSGRDASLFFHTGGSIRDSAPTVRVDVGKGNVSDMLERLEDVKKEAGKTIHRGIALDTKTLGASATKTASPKAPKPPKPRSSPTPSVAASPYRSIDESGFLGLKRLRLEHLEEDYDKKREKKEEEEEPGVRKSINNEWLKGIWTRSKPGVPVVDLQRHITTGLRRGYIMTRRHRKGTFKELHRRREFRAVVELSKKLRCDSLHEDEFLAILESAAETNQWKYADHFMNKHWHFVEQGPQSVNLTALRVFINMDFSIARAFVDQLMHDKRYRNKKYLAQVASIYLDGARTVALNLAEMKRFASHYQHLPFMTSPKILMIMLRGLHQLGSAKEVNVFQTYLCRKGLDKKQYTREVMLLKYLHNRNFGKALSLIGQRGYDKHRSLVSGYMALCNRQDWSGLLTLHKLVLEQKPDTPVDPKMLVCLIQAEGAVRGMSRAAELAKSQPISSGTVAALFRVFCLHYPEQAGDLERLLASPDVAEIRSLTAHLDLRNSVPMMLINSMDVRQGVAIAAFEGVHLERRRNIEALVKQGHPERAYKYYATLAKTEIPFSEHDYLTLVRGLCKGEFLELAEQVLADFEKAILDRSWRKRVCRLDVDMLRSKDAGIDSTEFGSGSPRAILADYVKKHCANKAPRRDGSVLTSPRYLTRTGYEWTAVALHMVSQGLYVEARDLLKGAEIREPMAYAILAECHARLGETAQIDKLIKEMKSHGVRTDQTYKTLIGMSEFHYGTGLSGVLNKLKMSVDDRNKDAIRDQGLFLETLVGGVRVHEEKDNQVERLQMTCT